MGIASSERSALEELAAARLRGAKPEQLLQLSEAAIDQATAAGDTLTIELVAAELDSAAAAHTGQGDGLRLRFAAERAHEIASQPPVFPASDHAFEPIPGSAESAFRLTGLLFGVILVLATFSIAAVAVLGDVSASYLIFFFVLLLVPLGLLIVALTGAVGIARWFRERRGGE